MRSPARARSRALATLAVIAVAVVVAAPVSANSAGFKTDKAAMLEGLLPQITVEPLITVGETLPGGYRFEAIPDGIAVDPRGTNTLDIYVNHETSKVPFPATLTDFDNAQLSHLVLKRGNGKILSGGYAIPSSANYQRFCSNFFAGPAQGFDRPLVLTNEEATDTVNRTGVAWPLTGGGSNPEQAGMVVAYDPALGQYKSIPGMGRHNHENSVAIPGYDDLWILSGDDTFSAPASQLYGYLAADTDAVWNDTGGLYAFVSNDPNVNDYGDLPSGSSVSGHFEPVPRAIAIGGQSGLETWSNDNNVFQFIRVEDLAYDRNDPRIVYIADTGEPRAKPGATAGARMTRESSSFKGPFMNGRIFKLVFNETNPTLVDSLSVLLNFDAGGYNNAGVVHQPDNLETTANSLLIQEDVGSHNRAGAVNNGITFTDATNARIWRYDLSDGTLEAVAEVDQSADEGPTDVDPAPAPAVKGDWESSGIVDVSQYFGRGAFLVTVQAHSLFVETAPLPSNTSILQKREGGQLLLVRIPGA